MALTELPFLKDGEATWVCVSCGSRFPDRFGAHFSFMAGLSEGSETQACRDLKEARKRMKARNATTDGEVSEHG